MPQTFTLNDFSAGWCPSDDAAGGRRNGLLQMDNVELDKNGSLSLSGGTNRVVTALAADAFAIYSKSINGARKDYAMTTGGVIYRISGGSATSIGTSGDSAVGAFGNAINYVLACSGNTRKKDNGSATVNLGVTTPSAPTFNNLTYAKTGKPSLVANTVNPTGTATTSGGRLQMTPASAIGGQCVVQTYNDSSAPYNWLSLTDSTASDTSVATDQDFIQLQSLFGVQQPGVISITLDILLVAGNSSGDRVTDYYTYTDDLFNLSGGSILRIRRSDFQRIGTSSATWATVYGFRLTLTISNTIWSVPIILCQDPGINTICFAGGSTALQGTIEFALQSVNSNNGYVGKSPLSISSGAINIDMGHVQLTLPDVSADTQINQIWIYARSSGGSGNLNQWYRVATSTTVSGGTVYILKSNIQALTDGIIVNLNLVSIASSSIADKIIAIVGPMEGRWFYFTTTLMYPSDLNDPDLVDPSKAVKLVSGSSEKFLWAHKVADAVILCGTSSDIYLLTGTFQTLPDFTIDIYYRALGVKYPPITYDAAVFAGAVYYLASDGWRAIDPSANNPLLSAPNLDTLYRGDTRYEYPPPSLPGANPGSTRFPICIAQNKIWCCIHTSTDRIEVYDFERKYWRPILFASAVGTAATTTPDGYPLVYFSASGLYELNHRDVLTINNGANNQTINILTPIFDAGSPRQRKDLYSLKARFYTGASGNITIKIIDGETNTSYTIANAVSSTSRESDHFYDVSQVIAILKNFQFQITGSPADFGLVDLELSYDLRPIQTTFVRVLASNFGRAARKRIYNMPFMIDSLGNDVVITPIADSVSQATKTVNSSIKKTFSYDLALSGTDLVVTPTDIEFTFQSTGLFEFFGFQQIPETDVEIFPTPNKAYVIPVTNFGTASKKRVRVWPFVINTLGANVTFTPIVDGSSGTPVTINTSNKQTYFFYFKTDVFGVDFSGTFAWAGATEFELWDIMQPDIVQVLPIARQFDQVGPAEFFKYGRIKQFELRCLAFGTSIPYKIYFNDNDVVDGSITTINGKETSYYIGTPKALTGGQIVRIELGPTAFDFHRFYMRLQVQRTGQNSDLEWVALPEPQQ